MGIQKKPRFFYGWVIVLVCFFSDFFMAGVATHSFSFILKPMSQELGWTRTMIVAGASLRTAIAALSGLIVGPLLDRYGPRPLIVAGALIAGAGIIALSRVSEIWQFYLLYGLTEGTGLTAMGGLVAITAVTKWFIRKRGRATAIVAAGLPVGGAVLGPITLYIIQHFGWRAAWLTLGLLICIVMIPMAALFLRRTPEDMGLLPDGEEIPPEQGAKEDSIARAASKLEEVWTLKAALRTPTLWLVIFAFILSGTALSAGMLHQTAYISDKGFPPAVMATNMVVWGLSAAVGSLFWGFLAERIPPRYCTAAGFFIGAGGLVILITAQNLQMVLIYAVVWGVAAGVSAPLQAIILANYYGRTFIGTIRGVVNPLHLISTAGGPLFAAYIYDTTKSYDLAFTIFSVCYLLGAFMILLARPPRLKG